jgi:hypothetical protein
VCDECWTVVRTVAAAELEQTIHEMELGLDVATVQCPHCGAVHVAPGFSKLVAFGRAEHLSRKNLLDRLNLVDGMGFEDYCLIDGR